MKMCVAVFLAATIALMGIPHALCACGCGWLGALVPTEGPDRVCPLCGDDASDRRPHDGPGTCKCGTCGAIEAVATAPAMSLPCPEDSGPVRLAQAPSLMELPPAALPGECGAAEPPGHFTGSHCALPILLGHLLL